MNLAEAV